MKTFVVLSVFVAAALADHGPPIVPIHRAPIHAAPIHAAPIHAAPVHALPVHAAPIHAAPIVHAPVHKAPIHPAPYKPAPAPYHPQPYDDTPKPYSYEYGVHDEYSGTNFNAHEVADGKIPDVSYEGVPQYPAHQPAPYAPAPHKPAPYHPAPVHPAPTYKPAPVLVHAAPVVPVKALPHPGPIHI